MNNTNKAPHKFSSISALHKVLGFPKPMHPLISLVDYAAITTPADELPERLLLDFYKISFKTKLTGKIKYGQHYYDFDEGGLSFISPNQVIESADGQKDYSGYTLLFHPDLLRSYPLAAKIRNYGFFMYSANEALHVSDKEKKTLVTVFDNIREELNSPIDELSQDVLVSYLEVLLNYSNRFYKRQFITRKTVSHDLLTKLEQLLTDYFNNDNALKNGLPTVEYLAAALNFSPRYLSDMLRSLTGRNARQHIHDKLIEKAKEYLSTTELSVAEIAYMLGFGQPQSFNKLFKKMTAQTPVAFKHGFQDN